ncbi:MAG TPA: 7-cyano-7-deazaguanine synthase QueC [Paludibacteraceae bacterium]|jgi:7-cyano-7-deazaguanine synthase|nr:7-cyano-7-deazaguanine synthase QueC [Paludibacteraceae bacterium]HOU69384.1 7-cyano-7-deazaguanine synthase QueC [Paludibacteraceae bacterium]HPH63502.1 7-cyano-7-deazaguanine synthase QueC [Paludibacteraceae bacterium]HQF51104.1 7-cyano-7-deazaguanine synthase QueC [Paludibacteraceae bacterium]
MADNKESAVVLLSGGQDSTTCLYWAKKHFDKVYAIGFRYGQKHQIETEIATQIAKEANVPFVVHDIDTIKKLTHNSLTDSSMVMDQEKPANSVPNTFVPGRNMIFITYAAVYAYGLGVHNIVTGVSQADYSGYPDCRNTFIKSVNASINLAMDYEFEIHTPLMWRDKEEVWGLAYELGVFDIVKNKTLTCYNSIVAEGCGHCPACKLRANGLKKFMESLEKEGKK